MRTKLITVLLALLVMGVVVSLVAVSLHSKPASKSPAEQPLEFSAAFDPSTLEIGTEDAVIAGTARGLDRIEVIVMDGDQMLIYPAQVKRGRWSIHTHLDGQPAPRPGTHRITVQGGGAVLTEGQLVVR